MWYSIAGMLSASFGASMLPVAKFAWERLEFILAPHQDREQQQQVNPTIPYNMVIWHTATYPYARRDRS